MLIRALLPCHVISAKIFISTQFLTSGLISPVSPEKRARKPWVRELMTSISWRVTVWTTSLRFCSSPSGHCTNRVLAPAQSTFFRMETRKAPKFDNRPYSNFEGLADPCHFGTDPDPRIHASDKRIRRSGAPYTAIFVNDLQNANKKLQFFCLLLFKVHLHHFSKIKSKKEVTKQ